MALALLVRNSCRLQGRIAPNSLKCLQRNTAISSQMATGKPTNLLKQTNLISRELATLALPSVRKASTSASHTPLWTAERVLSASLLGIVPIAFAFPSQAFDSLLAVSLVIHSHWGIEGAVTDYVRPALFGNVVPKVAQGMVIVLSVATLSGLFYFIFNDVGIAKAVRKIWAVKSQ